MFVLLAALYFLPTIVAGSRGHRIAGIMILNFFFAWTGIGWFALMLWALLSYPRYYIAAPGYPPNHWRNWP